MIDAFRLSFAFASVLMLGTSATRADDLQRYSRSKLHMGVEFEVVLYAKDSAIAETALAKAMARVAELDKRLSDYDLDSELSKLSETSIGTKDKSGPFPVVNVSDDLWTVLLESQVISRETEGAFDVTIGPLTKLWRRARRWKELPEPDSLAAAKHSVGHRFLQLDSERRTAQLMHSNMRLDLGGIAKGYAADEGVKAAAQAGCSRVLVRASGDIAAGDSPPGERGWRVGIAPLDPDEPPARFVEIAHCGVSTSGDARQHLIVNGRRYSHIIDPRTGECVSGRSSVTVIAPRGIVADGIDTAVSVLGPEKALAICERFPGIELLMVYESESGAQRTVESAGFKKFETGKSK
jgi:thiamine biosynthesis lipoprotein